MLPPMLLTFEVLPVPEYGPDDRVYKLRLNGKLLDFYLSQAFAGQLPAVRPSAQDGVFTVHYFHKQLGSNRPASPWFCRTLTVGQCVHRPRPPLHHVPGTYSPRRLARLRLP